MSITYLPRHPAQHGLLQFGMQEYRLPNSLSQLQFPVFELLTYKSAQSRAPEDSHVRLEQLMHFIIEMDLLVTFTVYCQGLQVEK